MYARVPDMAEDSRAAFHSILFSEPGSDAEMDARQEPEYFGDLHLDQIVAAITAGRDEYNLKPFFYTPLTSVDAIYYRHEVLRDLEGEALAGSIRLFADAMRKMRAGLAEAGQAHYNRQKQIWFRDAVEIYCGAVRHLRRDLSEADPGSRGLQAFRDLLAGYTRSNEFIALAADTEKLKADLAAIRYSLHIQGKRIRVSKYESEPDYGVDVLQTFEKFKQGSAKEYRFEARSPAEMNHIEAAVLDLVAQLYSETFSFLDDYCGRYAAFLNPVIARFDREVQFYAALLEHGAKFKRAGLSLCYPSVSHSKEVRGRGVFDLALADRLIREKTPVVTNDFDLEESERVFVVSGPNQGGKTTFARTFGQLHHLGSLGCPVPGRETRLFLCDTIYTHFEKEEDIRELTGKLEDELLRIHRILDQATPGSILVMNESFLSTTLQDALFLSKRIMERILALDLLCVSVTFLDELGAMSEKTVSMVSTVDPEDPARRTFKVVRRPADGRAYAAVIAEKYRLTYGSVKTRIAENNGEGAGS